MYLRIFMLLFFVFSGLILPSIKIDTIPPAVLEKVNLYIINLLVPLIWATY